MLLTLPLAAPAQTPPAAPADSLRRAGAPAAVPSRGASAADSVRAAAPDSAAAAPTGPWYARPKYIMLRSLVVPGWGQWANHRHLKAAVVAAGEGYLIYEAFDWGHLEHQYNVSAGSSVAGSGEQLFYEAAAIDAGSHRRDFTWWTIFAAVLSMGDAYVDAQLGRDFDAQFKPAEQALVPGRPGDAAPRLQLALTWKLP